MALPRVMCRPDFFLGGGPGVPGGCCVLAMACRPCGVVEVYCSDDASINDSGWTARAVVARTGRAGAGGSTIDKNGDAMRRGRGVELRNAGAELLYEMLVEEHAVSI